MDNSNKTKSDLLGMPHGTATGKLRKAILFQLVQETNKDICYRCKNKIKSVDDLSIEHKKPWQSSENPVESFFDLENIAFSHLNCNIATGEKRVPKYSIRGENNNSSKLTWKQVDEIRKKLDNGYTLIALSKEYLVDERNIAAIRDNKTWRVQID